MICRASRGLYDLSSIGCHPCHRLSDSTLAYPCRLALDKGYGFV